MARTILVGTFASFVVPTRPPYPGSFREHSKSLGFAKLDSHLENR